MLFCKYFVNISTAARRDKFICTNMLYLCVISPENLILGKATSNNKILCVISQKLQTNIDMATKSSLSTKQPRTATAPPNLITVLLRKGGGFSVEIVRTITALLTFKKMSPLVSMSKEAYEAKLILFKAPKEWVDGDEVRMMFRAMLGTVDSQWKRRNDTSLVETLMLGAKKQGDRHKTNVVADAWLRFLEKKKFPKLNSLCFSWSNITDARVAEVGRSCVNLQTLNLADCRNITGAGLSEVGRGCPNLRTLNLRSCNNITDASVLEVARRCPNLQTLNLGGCEITDTSVLWKLILEVLDSEKHTHAWLTWYSV